jgi:hypothetical protein
MRLNTAQSEEPFCSFTQPTIVIFQIRRRSKGVEMYGCCQAPRSATEKPSESEKRSIQGGHRIVASRGINMGEIGSNEELLGWKLYSLVKPFVVWQQGRVR